MEAVSSRVSNSDDRISRLPDPVICHILSFLETKIVVTTSILSKRWKFVWTGVNVLYFEEDGIDSDDEYDGLGDREISTGNGIVNIVQFVNNVLLHHDSKSLEKFQLTGRKGCKRQLVHVNSWISYALVCNVKSLTICVSGSVKIDLPAAIFTSGTLAFLSLSRYFKLKLPPGVCLPKLEDLGLYYLFYESNECVNKLLAGCPALHSLSIFRHSQDKVLSFRVSSPLLKRLELHLYPDVHNPDEILDFDGNVAIDAPNLECLELGDYVSSEVSITRLTAAKSVDIDLGLLIDATAAECNSVVKLVEALNNVSLLKLEGRVMRDLSHATIPLSATFDRLTKLNIYNCECCQWSCLSVLLSRLMRLETLDLSKNRCFEDTHEVCWKDPEEVPVCLSSTLSRVTINSFHGLDDEMEMIRYILKYGAVLQLIELKIWHPYSAEYKFELLQTISMFPRLSSACSIKFTCSNLVEDLEVKLSTSSAFST